MLFKSSVWCLPVVVSMAMLYATMNRYDSPSDEGFGLKFDLIGFMVANPGTRGVSSCACSR